MDKLIFLKLKHKDLIYLLMEAVTEEEREYIYKQMEKNNKELADEYIIRLQK